MYRILLIIGLSLTVFNISAQFPGAVARGGGANQNMNIGHFYGKVVDGKTNKSIEGVTVQLKGNKFDTATKKIKEIVLGTVITKANGDFSFESLAIFGNFKLKLSSLAYKTVDQTINFGIKIPSASAGGGNMQQILGMADKDLGNIKLEEDATNLSNVTVTASSKPQFELGIDRKIFNVDKNLMGSGQTATELMRNIPALNVDIDGNITLRNATPTLFIDGRPTTITLDQIPADIIDKVELITNPSAKFDASGGNAGILNIVLKKNKKSGYNGGIRAGIDSRAMLNGGSDINLRQNKINFTGSGMYNQRKSISTAITDRNNTLTIPSNIYNEQQSINTGYFAFIRGGIDYFADNRNTFSINANYNRGRFDNDQIQFLDSTIKNSPSSYSDISTLSRGNFKNLGSQLSYKHNFAKSGHNISADYNFNSSSNNNNSTIDNYTFNLNGTPKGIPLLQKGLGDGKTTNSTFQLDYENPLTDDTKFEAGFRFASRNFTNQLNQFRFNPAINQFVLVPFISSRYKYIDEVFAAYSTYSFRVKKWSYQLGLRAESSNYKGTLLNSTGADSASFKVDFPLSLFPSAFITYKINEKQDYQINYSRRVNRPNFFQLMPFPDYSDPQNINIGNAGLKPEFTHSLEMSWNNAYKKGSNFLATLFFKQSTNLITRYIYRDANALVPGDTAFFSTFINANSARSFGLELTNKIALTTWWEATVNLNIFNSRINATIAGQPDLVQDQWSWFAKMNHSFKIIKGLSVQLSGDYQARTVLPQGGGGGRGGGMMFGGGPQSGAQGFNLPRYGVDLAIRQEFTWKKGRTANLTLGMNDIFRTQLFQSYSESSFFNQTAQRRRDPQILRLNFGYRFGKFDTSLFKRKNTKADQSGGMDMIQ